MMTTMQSTTIEYSQPASVEEVEVTINSMKARGFQVQLVDTAEQALAKVLDLIPKGVAIMTAGSKTLLDIGLEERLIRKDHPWINLKDELLAESDPALQMQLRLKSTLAPWYLGSVQAIAQTGEMVVASGSGSQLPAYAYSSRNLLLVVGVQKIVPSLEDAIRRLREYSLPLEDAKAKAMGRKGATLAKILIMEQEPPQFQRNVHVILVNEPVGA